MISYDLFILRVESDFYTSSIVVSNFSMFFWSCCSKTFDLIKRPFEGRFVSTYFEQVLYSMSKSGDPTLPLRMVKV